MTPNHGTVDIEESSSSAASFVHSMNLLSTDKDSDSRDVSDLSAQGGQGEATEESSESDHSDERQSPTSSFAKDVSTVLSKKEEPPAAATSGDLSHSSPPRDSRDSAKETTVTSVRSDRATDAIPAVAPAVANQSVVCEPPVTSELKAPQVTATGRDPSHDDEKGSQPLERPIPPTTTKDARQDYEGKINTGISSDVSSTNVSASSGSSIRSDVLSVSSVPRTSPVALGATAGVEPKAPVGHIQVTANPPNLASPGASQAKFHRADGSASNIVPQATASTMSVGSTGSTRSKSSSSLRRGKWTVEEEAYVARVIQDFNSGFLNAPAGTTLRSYLSEKLHCDPMRITKKFTGDSCIGKRVFHPAVRCAVNAAAIDKAQAELEALERRWRRRLEMQQRESAKKAAASAAAAAAAATGRSHMHGHVAHAPSAAGAAGDPSTHATAPLPAGHPSKQTAVARTASWLDRANAILSGQKETAPTIPPQPVQPPGVVGALPPNVIEDQMKEVQRLISEGPVIQQTTAGLPHFLDQSGQRKVTDDISNIPTQVGPVNPPLDKRPRTSGAEDAEALVGFLNSVRASAEASGNQS